MNIYNQARLDFKINPPSSPCVYDKTIFSNEALTIITDNILETNLTVDKSCVSIFEIFTNCVTIKNLTTVAIENIYYKNHIPFGIKLIPCSVFIDDILANCINPASGFYIPLLKPNSTIKVSFSYMATQLAPSQFTHSVMLKFLYTDTPLINPYLVRIQTNSVSMKITNKLFQQIMICNELVPPKKYPKPHGVNTIDATVKLIETKVLSPPKRYIENERQIESLLYLIIGKIQYNVDYKLARGSCNSDSSLKFSETLGFSTTMIVPSGIQFKKPKRLSFVIEDLSYEVVNNKIFCNTYMLVKV